MRRLSSRLICVLLLLEINLPILIADRPVHANPASNTISVPQINVDDASFVMPITINDALRESDTRDYVPPAPIQNSTGIDQMIEPPHKLAEPDEIVGRNYNDIGWYSFPEWSRATWRPRSGDRFGEFSLQGRSASPIETWEGLSLTHGYGIYFLSGPNQTDLPPRLFEYQLGLHWFGEVTDDIWLDLAIAGGLHTDFEDSTRDGWRVPAHAVLTWKIEDEFQPVIGLRFFDRNDLGFVPVAGVILRPNENLRLEFVYPEPRVSWRIGNDAEEDHWISISGRIGGGEWAIERAASGLADVVTYNAYELTLGFETFKTNRSISAVELGYTFDRDLKYRSKQGNYEPQETYFLRYSLRK